MGPQLQQLTGGNLVWQAVQKFNTVRYHISARFLWQTGQLRIYNVKVSHLNANQYENAGTRKSNVKRKCHIEKELLILNMEVLHH